MRLVIYFLCLNLLLLGSYRSLHAAAHQTSRSNFTSHRVHHSQHFNCDQAFIKTAASDQQDRFLADIEPEDEQTTNLFIKKYRSLADWSLTIIRYLSFTSRYNVLQDRPSFGLHLSARYIVQRTLRI